MAEEGEEAPAEGEVEGEEGGKKSKLPLIIGGVAALVAVLVGAAFFMGVFSSPPASQQTAEASANDEPEKPAIYFDLPEMVVNLSSHNGRAKYLKLKIALETDSQEVVGALTPVMPRILDMFQVYLRELRETDLDGSAGLYRMKQELLRRINIALHPKTVRRVLFKEIYVQ